MCSTRLGKLTEVVVGIWGSATHTFETQTVNNFCRNWNGAIFALSVSLPEPTFMRLNDSERNMPSNKGSQLSWTLSRKKLLNFQDKDCNIVVWPLIMAT